MLRTLIDDLLEFIGKHPEYGLISTVLLLLILLFKVLTFLAEVVPQIKVIKADLFIPLSTWLKFKHLEKAAIKADIEGNVNTVILQLEKELPPQWLRRISIKWVRHENKEVFLSENKAVIKMKPVAQEQTNFVNAVYLFLNNNFFPNTGNAIPAITKESCVLQVVKRLINERKPEYKHDFEDVILEPAVSKNNKILDYLMRFDQIDTKGFFTGTFLREIYEIARKSRFSLERKSIPHEAAELLKHIELFSKRINAETEDEKLKSSDWFRYGMNTSYRFLLVAKPVKMKLGTRQYVNRIREGLGDGIERFYVFGTEREKTFVKRVIGTIRKKIPECELQEVYNLHYDYRGNKGGIGALFSVR